MSHQENLPEHNPAHADQSHAEPKASSCKQCFEIPLQPAGSTAESRAKQKPRRRGSALSSKRQGPSNKQQPSNKQRPRRVQRNCQFESLEERLALTANALVDIPAPTTQLEVDPAGPATQLGDQQIRTQLADTNSTSGVDYVQQNYGFDGTGQTVAVIDTGIAWDHYALGGGFGEDYRVVGGWDFAENDANPYDDGPAGYHGTHVAGIIGSEDSTHTGVASGVDLVALRVFNDSGQSQFDWIEQALQWVHENRNAFENPITTVNLSLGVHWNADTIPGWAMLEDEFAQLESDGIFISVAAGNFFQNYQTPGLSYPASSPHVVPVASHDAEGQLSDFSQRNERVIAAPGEDIYSTVPDHLFMGSRTGQFLRASGTSMAAPYLAGASTLIREAYAFMGHGEVTQDQIYQHFQDTATRIFDSATNASYDRMNLQAAIDAIVTDRHADNWEQATELGSINADSTLSADGVIGQFTDVDTFTFTAQQTGRVSLNVEQSHDLVSRFRLEHGNFDVHEGRIEFDVQAGQTVRFSLETVSGIGHYQIEAQLAAANDSSPFDNAIDWGSISDTRPDSFELREEAWFRFTASQSGTLSLLSTANHSSPLQFEVYDAQHNLVASLETQQIGRLDLTATAGQEFFLRVATSEGTPNRIDMRLQNLVSVSAERIAISGTAGDDTVQLSQSADALAVILNGVEYRFDDWQQTQVVVSAGEGYDQLGVQITATDQQLELGKAELAWVHSNGHELLAHGFEFQKVDSQAAGNSLAMHGTSGSDTLLSKSTTTFLSGRGYSNRASGFSSIDVHTGDGYDMAFVYGNDATSELVLGPDGIQLERAEQGVEVQGVEVQGVEYARGVAGRGDLRLELNGSAGSDHVRIDSATVRGNLGSLRFQVTGAEQASFDGAAGSDTLRIADTAGTDQLQVTNGSVSWTSDLATATYIAATNVETIFAEGSGTDAMDIASTTHNIDGELRHGRQKLQVGGTSVYGEGFSIVQITGNGSNDAVDVHGSTGNERAYWIGDQVTVLGTGLQYRLSGIESSSIDGGGGYDVAILYGTSNTEEFAAGREGNVAWNGQTANGSLSGFERYIVNGRGGGDRVDLSEFEESDQLTGHGQTLNAELGGIQYYFRNLENLRASTNPNSSSHADLDAVDYLFELEGDWDQIP